MIIIQGRVCHFTREMNLLVMRRWFFSWIETKAEDRVFFWTQVSTSGDAQSLLYKTGLFTVRPGEGGSQDMEFWISGEVENLRPNRFRKECHLNFFDKTASRSYNRTETVGTLPLFLSQEPPQCVHHRYCPAPRLSVPTFPGHLQSPDLPRSKPEHLDELPQSSTNSGVSKQKNLDFNYKQELFKISTLSRNEKCFSHIRQREWTPMVSVKPKIEEHPYPSLPSVGWGPAQKQMAWLFLCLESSTHSARAWAPQEGGINIGCLLIPSCSKPSPFREHGMLGGEVKILTHMYSAQIGEIKDTNLKK